MLSNTQTLDMPINTALYAIGNSIVYIYVCRVGKSLLTKQDKKLCKPT